MINFKKTALAVLALSSSTAFAGSMGPVCMAGSVTVPCANNGWDVGVQALYLKPSYNGSLSWGGANVNTIITINSGVESEVTSNNPVENNSAWKWGFKLEASYHFRTGNDLNLNWYHLIPKTTTIHSTSSATAIRINPAAPTVFAEAIQTTSTRPSWDAVNLEFGQQVDFGVRKKIRFHGGAEYAHIKTIFSAGANGTAIDSGVSVVPQVISAAITSTYNGFGPRIGADMSYDLPKGFTMYAKGATSILVGSSSISSSSSDNEDNSVITSQNGKKTAIVPELEAKLGLNYSYAMAQGHLTLDGGYMWVNYFNTQIDESINSDSNFAVQGPFVGLKWLGNV